MKNDLPQGHSRRSFMKQSAVAGTFLLLPSHFVVGSKNKVNPGLPPSERVNLALIGIGNRGNLNRIQVVNTGLTNIVALCDVDLEGPQCVEALAAHPEAKCFTDFRKMFDEMGDGIDAVLISTPDHSHFSITMLAMSLGKHVYTEKPLAHNFGQCERLMDLAARSGVVTQMGNQGHSGGNYFQFKAWVEGGVIKDVTRITANMNNARRWHGWGTGVTGYPTDPLPEGMDWETWLDYATANPYSEKLHQGNWRCWFDYGSGAFGDWGPHILDTCHRFLKLGLPESISPVMRDGPNPFVFPQASTIEFKFPEREGMPPCVVTWYDGVDNKPLVEPEYGDLVKDEATGESTRKPVTIKRPGKIIYSRDLVFQGGSHADVLQIIPREKFMEMRTTLPRFPQRQSNHYENFLLACKGEEETRSPFSVGAPLTQVFNLAILAQRLGEPLQFDRSTRQVTNSKAANALLDPAPRKGWEMYYNL
jgi:predicted dehydrogenase